MDAPKLNKFQITSISWADDLLISSLDESGLQKCINNLELYAKEWGLVVSMKKARCVIFSKGSTNYTNQHQFIYGDQLIPYEKFYKYLGVEITNNCEFKMAREQRVTKACNAIFSIRKALATSGNVSVKLSMSLFDSKIEPILTYGSIIWGIESNTNSIIINGLKEDSEKSSKEQALEHLKLILTNSDEQVNLDIVKRMRRKNKENQIRPILVKFKDNHIKAKIIYRGKCDLNSISLKDNSNSNTFSGIQLVQDNFIKFTLNLSKNCSNFISRSEVGKFPLIVKIWTQMVKYFLRLCQGTNNNQ